MPTPKNSPDLPDCRIIPLDNGLELKISDRTRHYFGGYLVVKLELSCTVPLDERLLSPELYREAAGRLDSVTFRRVLERMGVPSGEKDAVAEGLLADFLETSGKYLSSPRFPELIFRRELDRRKR